MDTSAEFKITLRALRVARDLTQEALAEAVGCAAQTIRSFEIGRRRPSREMAARIADIFGLAPVEREQFLRLARTPLNSGPAEAQVLPPDPAPIAETFQPQAPPAVHLIGRQHELDEIQRTLLDDDRRLVTLLGPGGIGKTCLAIQAGHQLADQFADGVGYVALAALNDPSGLAGTIAEAIGCSLAGARSPEIALCNVLRDRELLLILDNFEQLIQDDRQPLTLLSTLLEEAPRLRVLITSRERLRLRDEWVIAIDGLSLPADRPGSPIEQSAAVLLFLERARQLDGRFSLSRQNSPDVARICRILGGVPLAIELAAAWSRVLSCAEIAAQVAQDAAALEATTADTPQRHRSLKAVLDQSWRLLAAEDQHLLAHLSLFRGGCRREALAAVLQVAPSQTALLASLAVLVDGSLIRRVPTEDGGTRYDLHEFVRQYAASRLAEMPAAAEAEARHAIYFSTWLAEQEEALKSARQRSVGAAISAEAPNVRAAWQWACARGDAVMLRRMIPTLDWFYELRGWYDEAAEAFDRAQSALQPAIADPSTTEITLVCYWIAVGRSGFHRMRRDPAFAAQRLAESVAQLRRTSSTGEQIHCIKGLAYINIFAGNYTLAESLLSEAQQIATTYGDRWNLAMTLLIRAVMEGLRSEPATALRHLSDALDSARGVGDPRPVAMALTYLGLSTLALGDPDKAEAFIREAHILAVEHHDRFQISLALQALGRVALARDDQSAARWLLNESLTSAREIGDRWLETQALGCLAALAAAKGDSDAARNGRRAALRVAAAVPAAIALDEALELALLEQHSQPAAALTALAYVRRHPLTRPVARSTAETHWEAAARRLGAPALAAAEAAATDIPTQRPAALLDVLGAA